MSGRDWGKLAVILLVLVAAVALVAHIQGRRDTEETELVRAAIRDAALTCYAVEGAYPDDVAYLREHYRLAYNEDKYFITYDAFSSNIMPDIWVTEKGAEAP
ncbi:MAG: hypothetical protein IKH77_07140 [Clostridia bacterium]|nr:hypothetical protein [Clostridia bacterium]